MSEGFSRKNLLHFLNRYVIVIYESRDTLVSRTGKVIEVTPTHLILEKQEPIPNKKIREIGTTKETM